MNGNEYQQLAMRTKAISDDEKMEMLYHSVLGLNSEAGEIAGLLQKVYQGHVLNYDHLKKELGDCMWMIAEACSAIDCSIDDVMQINIDKLRNRFPDGFEIDKSINRMKDDI